METSLKLTDEHFSDLKGELQAMSKILTRSKKAADFTQYFYKSGDTLQATDRHQLAKVNNELLGILEDGFYSFIKKNSKEFFLVKEDFDGSFPDSKDLFDCPLEWQSTEFIWRDGTLDLFEYSVCTLVLETGLKIDFKLLKNIKTLMPSRVYYKDYLMFTNGSFSYLLMPLSV